jgi:hypothetical protein
VIRRVAFRKAILAGVGRRARLGDLVHLLGTTLVGNQSAWLWWPAGLALHAGVSAIWAIFYAYFFWSTFELPPAFQELAFSSIPTVLAGVVMLLEIG